MTRQLIVVPLVLGLAACSVGTQTDYSAPEDAAASRHLNYTGTPLNPPAERDMPACPDAMPTNGATGSPHEVAGPMFCDF